MSNILFVIRVGKRNEPDPGYAARRVRDQAGEIIDWLPDGTHPGLAVLDDPQYRVIQVTGAAMTPALAASLCSQDVLAAPDVSKGFLPRYRIWQINYNNLPAGVLAALRVRVPFAQRGTYYDASYSAAQINAVLHQKKTEPRDLQGFPADDGEIIADL